MTAKRFLITLILSMCLLVLNACALFPDEEDDLKPPLVEPVKPNINIHVVKRGKVTKEIRASGVLQTTSQIRHSFKTSGKIKEIFVKRGQVVRQGDLLIEQDIKGIKLILLERQLELEQTNWDLQQARQNNENATLIKIKELKYSIAQNAYKEALLTLDQSRLHAEMDGTVTFLIQPDDPAYRFKEGEVLAVISDSSELIVMISDVGKDKDELTEGMQAKVTYKDKVYNGVVVQAPQTAINTINEADKNRVYIQFDEQPKDAQFGESVEAGIVISHKEDTLFIPKNALRSFSGRSYVLLLNGESRREVDVLIGIDTSTIVEVLEGLSEGDQLILK